MTTYPVSTVIGVDRLPPAIRALGTMPHVDYADLYTTTVTDDRSAEDWARAILEATALGHRARTLWKGLGLRLGPPASDDHIQGWRIAARGRTWVRLETRSWYMTAEAVVHRENDELSLALFLRYDQPIAPLVWRFVSGPHQRGVPVMLRQATSSESSPLARVERSDE